MKKIFTIALFTVCCWNKTLCQGQSPATKPEPDKKAVAFDLSGQITIAKDEGSNVFLTCGGPGIRFGKGKVALTVGMYPSLRYNYEYSETIDKTPVTTILGTGAQLSYKHITAGCLFYLVKNLWYAAPAIGYKFK